MGQHNHLKTFAKGVFVVIERAVCVSVCVCVCFFVCAMEHPDSLGTHTATGDHTGAIWEKTFQQLTQNPVCTQSFAHAHTTLV